MALQTSAFHPLTLLDVIASDNPPNNWNQADKLPPADCVLILAVAAELVGTSRTQDDTIAAVLTESHLDRTFRRHVDDLLNGPYVLRTVARRLLSEMAMRTQSEILRKAVQSIDPLLVREDKAP